MTITQRNGDVTTVTIEPQEEQKLKQFEQDAINQNMIVEQHGAAMLEKEQPKNNNIKPDDDGLPNFLKIHKGMKTIVSGGKEVTSSYTYSIPKVQPHIASSTSTTSTTSFNNINTNVVLRNLMKKITNGTSPF
jgi:hypothetical protein